MEFERVIKTEISPMNNNDSGFSFANGNPNIVFICSKQMGMMDLRSLRLNATLEVKDNNGLLPNNNANKGGTALNYQIDAYSGFGAIIKQINISRSDGSQIESIRNYNQMLKFLSVAHSEGDYNTVAQNKYGVSPYVKVANNSINQKQDVSLELLSGVLAMNKVYPLHTMDLQISIELSTDTNVFLADATKAVTYNLTNVTMTYDVFVPNDVGREMIENDNKGEFSYNTLTSLYSITESSDSTTDYNLNAGRVRSVMTSIVPTSYLNTYTQNGLKMTRLENSTDETTLDAVSFKRNGVNYPYDEELRVEVPSVSRRPETSVLKEFINSVVDHKNQEYTLMRINNVTREATANEELNVEGVSENINKGVSSQAIYGIGVNMDDVTDVGIDMRNASFSQRIQSGLNGTKAMSLFTNVLARNDVVYDNMEVSVIS